MYERLLPSASRPIKVMDQRVRFRAPVDTDSAVLHLLIAGKEEPGTETSTQSAAMVSNNFLIFLIYKNSNFLTKNTKDKQTRE